jgi:hypothetical protein
MFDAIRVVLANRMVRVNAAMADIGHGHMRSVTEQAALLTLL